MKCAFRDDLQCDVRERRAGRGTNLATLTVYYKWAPERPHNPPERIHTHNPACARHPTLRTLLRFSMLRTISFSYIFLKYGDCVCFFMFNVLRTLVTPPHKRPVVSGRSHFITRQADGPGSRTNASRTIAVLAGRAFHLFARPSEPLELDTHTLNLSFTLFWAWCSR